MRMPGPSRGGLVSTLLPVWLTVVFLTAGMTGCGTSSNPAESCKALSQVNLPGDSQVVRLLEPAGYHDCLISYEADPEKADTLRRQGQLEAIKGTMLIPMKLPATESLRSRIFATSDLNTLLGFFFLLKASKTFSEADVKKLDETFPHLQIANAFHNYEQRSSPH
jgi:hypothetical protein